MAQQIKPEMRNSQAPQLADLTASAAADLLGVDRNTFSSWVRKGRIRGIKARGQRRVYYSRESVLALKGGGPPPPNGGGRRLHVVEDRRDQLTLDEALEAGGLDRDRAEAAIKLLHPYRIAALTKPGLRMVTGGLDDEAGDDPGPLWMRATLASLEYFNHAVLARRDLSEQDRAQLEAQLDVIIKARRQLDGRQPDDGEEIPIGGPPEVA
jgi:excisionase family DNA binding protein